MLFRSICFIYFLENIDLEKLLKEVSINFKNFVLYNNQEKADYYKKIIFENKHSTISLKLIGSEFRLNVWTALLNLSNIDTCSYIDVAHKINKPSAVRAVATAIGKNPISYIIPCHKIIPINGKIGNYRWGQKLKKRFILNESHNNL